MWHGLQVTNFAIVLALFFSSFAQAQFASGTFFKSRRLPLTFSTAPQTLAAGVCSSITTVTTPANVLAPLTIDLTSSGSVAFYSDPACTLAITSVLIATGTNSANFYYLNEIVENPILTVSASQYSNGNQTTTIQTNQFVWTGSGGNANWTTGLNWSGGVAPNNTQVAVFNSVCVSNCSPTINANLDIRGIRLTSGYSGTITQSNGFTMVLGVGGWVMSAGTFVGGNSNITVNANAGFQLLGGSFTSTTARLRLYAPIDQDTNLFIMPDAGATFLHNNGTFEFSRNGNPCFGVNYYLSVPNNLNFYHFNVASGGTSCGGHQRFVINAGKTINVLGTFSDFSVRSAIDGGTIYLHENYVATNTTYAGGSAVLMFVGLTNQTYQGGNAGSDYGTANVKINKPISGTVTPANSNTWGADSFEIIAGEFTAPSTQLSVGRGQFNTLNIFTVPNGVTFNHNNGKINFVGTIGTCSSYTYNINVPNNFTLNHVTFDRTGGSGCGASQLFQVQVGNTLRVLGNLEHLFGQLGGNIEFNGNYTLDSNTGNGGTATLVATGSGNQIFSRIGTGSMPSGTFTINQSGTGKIILASNLIFGSGGDARTWNLVSGEIFMSGFNLTLQSLNLNSNTIHKRNEAANSGTGVLTVGGSVIANGAFLGGTVSD